MSASTPPGTREQGRLGAYVSRNRSSLTRSAQQILATTGPSAPIKQFADRAGMSVGSIYQHFGSKEGMIEAAVVDALVAWDHWVEAEIADVDDEAERLVTPMRLLTRLASTHPEFAAMFASCSNVLTRIFMTVQPARPSSLVRSLAEAGRIPDEDLELGIQTVLLSVAMLALVCISSDHVDDSEADRSIALIIGMLGFTPEEAARLTALPLRLPDAPKTPPSP